MRCSFAGVVQAWTERHSKSTTTACRISRTRSIWSCASLPTISPATQRVAAWRRPQRATTWRQSLAGWRNLWQLPRAAGPEWPTSLLLGRPQASSLKLCPCAFPWALPTSTMTGVATSARQSGCSTCCDTPPACSCRVYAATARCGHLSTRSCFRRHRVRATRFSATSCAELAVAFLATVSPLRHNCAKSSRMRTLCAFWCIN